MSDRRTFLKAAAMGAPAIILGCTELLAQATSPKVAASAAIQSKTLMPPTSGPIKVAFLILEGANVMDIAGAWEVFNETMLTAKGKPWHEKDGLDDMLMPFETYTVSDSLAPVRAGNGLMIVPNYSFETAPKPRVIVVPAQKGRTEAQKAWLLSQSTASDVTMSICTGASVLAQYGLLDGLTVTTHHLFAEDMQKEYPAVHFMGGIRFVDHGKIATAGGLTSGIDLALHVVGRYDGRDVAQVTAETLEYHSQLWKNPKFADIRAVASAK